MRLPNKKLIHLSCGNDGFRFFMSVFGMDCISGCAMLRTNFLSFGDHGFRERFSYCNSIGVFGPHGSASLDPMGLVDEV